MASRVLCTLRTAATRFLSAALPELGAAASMRQAPHCHCASCSERRRRPKSFSTVRHAYVRLIPHESPVRVPQTRDVYICTSQHNAQDAAADPHTPRGTCARTTGTRAKARPRLPRDTCRTTWCLRTGTRRALRGTKGSELSLSRVKPAFEGLLQGRDLQNRAPSFVHTPRKKRRRLAQHLSANASECRQGPTRHERLKTLTRKTNR